MLPRAIWILPVWTQSYGVTRQVPGTIRLFHHTLTLEHSKFELEPLIFGVHSPGHDFTVLAAQPDRRSPQHFQ
jgi:hypothetical protein